MDFALLPPEINSERMYTGPGAAPMVEAAAAWGALAAELRSAVSTYSSTIADLTARWRGPSSAKMAHAAASYATWIGATAANAEHTAEQAQAAAGAFDAAFAATVPPPIVAANRAQLAFLIASNVLGQNTPAIAATEIQYAEMWAQDATAMNTYALSSAAASQMTAFAAPPRATNPLGANDHDEPAAQAATTLSTMLSSLDTSAAPAASAADPVTTAINTLFSPTSPISLLSPLIGGYLIGTEPYGLASVGSSVAGLYQKVMALPSVPGGAVGPSDVSVTASTVGSPAAVSAELGRAGVVGRLSVPQGWAAAAPEIRLAATAAPGIGLGSVPTGIVADVPGNVYGTVALQSAASRAAAHPEGFGRGGRAVQPWQNSTTIIVISDDE